MRVLFTCRGTAGHVNPAVALTQMFQTRNSGYGALFVGADGGMETRLVPREGHPIETVIITNFRRSLSPASVGHDVRTPLSINKSRKQTNAILDRLQPDLVVGTGGYAFLPVVKTVAKRGIPTAVHESNAVPGPTTETLSEVMDVVVVSSEESRSHYNDPGKAVVIGAPVRTDFFRYTRKKARAELGLTNDRSLIPSVWGSLGAEVMNCQTAKYIALEYQDGASFYHIHGVGRDYRAVLDAFQGSGLVDHPEVDVQEYIYDIPLMVAAADLVPYRAGAPAIAEIATIAKPAVLVPSSNMAADRQTKNARVSANVGGAVLLPEEESSGEELYALMTGLFSDAPRWEVMSRVLRNMATSDTTEQIHQTLIRLMEEQAN